MFSILVITNAIGNNEERKENHCGRHKILTRKTLFNKERKTHGCQATKLHYIDKCL
jgi:hypothetical protein